MVTRFAPRSARRWGWSPAIRRRESPTACIRLAMEPLEARHLLAVGGFTAFNEHVAGAGTHTNTTLYGADPASDSSGPLKDIDTGQNTSVVLSTAQVGVVFGSQGAAPAGGTDAGNLFNGFVDFAGPAPHSLEIEQGDSYTHTLTGLDPNKSYEFAGTAVRGNNA